MTNLSSGYRSLAGTIHDVDDRSHRVAIDVPHERLDSFGTSWGAHCWRASFAKRLPDLLREHKRDDLIGRAIKAESLGARSRVIGQFEDFATNRTAKKAFEEIKDGRLAGWSWHFTHAIAEPHPTVKGAFRYKSADVDEFSAVARPALAGAQTSGIRSDRLSMPGDVLPNNDSDLERALFDVRDRLNLKKAMGAPSDEIAHLEQVLADLVVEYVKTYGHAPPPPAFGDVEVTTAPMSEGPRSRAQLLFDLDVALSVAEQDVALKRRELGLPAASTRISRDALARHAHATAAEIRRLVEAVGQSGHRSDTRTGSRALLIASTLSKLDSYSSRDSGRKAGAK